MKLYDKNKTVISVKSILTASYKKGRLSDFCMSITFKRNIMQNFDYVDKKVMESDLNRINDLIDAIEFR